MWTWKIGLGELFDPQGRLFAKGYSGKGKGLNNPRMQGCHGEQGKSDAGPIPVGRYAICAPVDRHGGFALPLIPDPVNEMHGRGSFLIHGDLVEAAKDPNDASLGCVIVSPRLKRIQVWQSEDHELSVTE
jgi:hypothetical protein